MCKESRSAVQVVTPDTLRHEQHDLVLIKMEYPPEITTHATSPPPPVHPCCLESGGRGRPVVGVGGAVLTEAGSCGSWMCVPPSVPFQQHKQSAHPRSESSRPSGKCLCCEERDACTQVDGESLLKLVCNTFFHPFKVVTEVCFCVN